MSAAVRSPKTPEVLPALLVKNFLDLPGCTFSRTGLRIEPGLKFEQWAGIGEVLKIVAGSIQFWIGDWIRYGEHEYGDKYTQAVLETGLDDGTLRNCVFVAQNVHVSLRNDKLSFSHHAAIASLSPAKQKEWLGRAEKEDLSSRELRKRVEVSKSFARISSKGGEQAAADLVAHIERAIVKIKDEILTDCPDKEFGRRYYEPWIEELRFELHERGLVDAQEKIVAAWEQGYRKDEELQKITGYSKGVIGQLLGRLGWSKVRQVKTTAMARGDVSWIWHKPGEKLGSDMQLSRAGGRDASEDEDF